MSTPFLRLSPISEKYPFLTERLVPPWNRFRLKIGLFRSHLRIDPSLEYSDDSATSGRFGSRFLAPKTSGLFLSCHFSNLILKFGLSNSGNLRFSVFLSHQNAVVEHVLKLRNVCDDVNSEFRIFFNSFSQQFNYSKLPRLVQRFERLVADK